MTAISLRAYNREIEAMVDRGQNDDAVTHCKYILKYFPKHVGTYRLLGKAFLESHHYSEAADILQRVLSVVPDDFISNIGMSIIREDEGNLDAAIWHMERAFEVQPSNTAVQGELRRLYGLRDGIEPPKVRLTRGALVRMYAKSELYPQAIAELNAALAEDPQRVDLETILAQMYFKSGKKIEAAEICSRLISKLPYCLEANKLLAEILPSTSRAEEAKVFSQHLTSLDPYYGHISSTVPLVDDVPDNAVMLERLEAISGDTRIQPLTPNAPATVEAEQQEAIPDWLPKNQDVTPTESPFQPIEGTSAPEQPSPMDQAGTNKETPPMSQDAPVPPNDNPIPDWMREAGWSQSADTPPESASNSSNPEAGKEEEIVPAELPDWLKSMAPAEETESPANNPQEDEKLGILNQILPGAPGEDSAANDTEEPIFESTGGAVTRLFSEEAIRQAEQSAPDALELNQNPPVATSSTKNENAESLPDWLAEPGPGKAAETAKNVATPLPAETTPAQPIEEPAAASEEAQEKAPDWLKALAAENPPTPEETSQAPKSTEEEPQADWIKDVSSETEEDEFGYVSDNQRGSTKQLNEEETSPAPIPENMPDWLKQQPVNLEKEIAPQEETFPQPPETTQPYTEPNTQPSASVPKPIRQEQPISENAPEMAEKEELPDWLQELENNRPEQQAAQPVAAAANIDPSLKEWLDTLDAEKEAETKAEPTQQPMPMAEIPSTPEIIPEQAEPLPEVKAGVTLSVQPEVEETDFIQPAVSKPIEAPPSPVAPVEPVRQPPETLPHPARPKTASGKKRPSAPIIADEVLAQARRALIAQKADEAADLYEQLIRADEKLEEITHDLQDALSRNPINISIWQTLGDCYAKNKQLQEALNAYTKAEELLR